jgi:copper chaperone CopZ
MNQTTKIKVDMNCGGCPNALRRIVKRINKEAIGEVHANPSTNILTVQHTEAVTSKDILDKVTLWADAAEVGPVTIVADKKRKTPSTTTSEEEKEEEERRAEKDLYSGGRRTRGKKRTKSRRKSKRRKRRKSRRRKRRRKKRTKRRR